MPTDCPIFESDMLHKIKTKFHGNPRYVEVADKFIKMLKKKTEYTVSNTILNEEYMEGAEEEHKKEIKQLENTIFNDITSVSEAEEIMEIV